MAVQFGYCGLDRRRLPLVGDEIRPCWQARPAAAEDDQPVDLPASAVARTFDFVPLGEAVPVAATVSDGAERSSLWGEPTDR